MVKYKGYVLLLIFLGLVGACAYNKGDDPGPLGPPVSFQAEIKPIIINNCVICHSDTATNPDRPGYAFFLKVPDDFSELHTYATTVSSVNSAYTIVQARLHGIEQPQMPYNRSPLPDSTLKKIDRWIRQGAPINN